MMRFVTWNCRIGAFKRKARHIEPYRPDVLAVQEVERLDNILLFDGKLQPTFRNRLTHPIYPKRSIGVFSYTNTELTPVDLEDPMYCFRRFKARKGDRSFQVVAVWTAPAHPRKLSYRQAHDGLCRHADWIRSSPTVMMGDFNGNGSYKSSRWPELLDLANGLELVSAYHHYFNEPFGLETRPTHFSRGIESAAFHLDYCFVPAEWAQYITRVEVGTYAAWCKLSDHVPLIVDLVLPGSGCNCVVSAADSVLPVEGG